MYAWLKEWSDWTSQHEVRQVHGETPLPYIVFRGRPFWQRMLGMVTARNWLGLPHSLHSLSCRVWWENSMWLYILCTQFWPCIKCINAMSSMFIGPHKLHKQLDIDVSSTDIAMGLQAVEQSETIHRVEDACICSSLHIQGTFTYTDSHRCPLHNDTLEHDCTVKNIVPGLIVPSDERLDTPQPVEDRCICSSLHIHGNSVNVHYYHRCPIHNNTASWRWCPIHNDSEVTVP